jgi:hypothetical protein
MTLQILNDFRQGENIPEGGARKKMNIQYIISKEWQKNCIKRIKMLILGNGIGGKKMIPRSLRLLPWALPGWPVFMWDTGRTWMS